MKKWVVFGAVFIAAAVLIAGCAEPTPPEPTPTPTPLPNIVEKLDEMGDFTTLIAAVQAAGLDSELATGGPYTLFAPNDAAFEKLPEGLLDELLADPEGLLTQILLYHVTAGARTAEENLGLQSVVTLQGSSLEFASVDGVPMINGEAEILEVDIEAENGVIHVIDTVLVPPEIPEPTPTEEPQEPLPNLIETLNESGEFTTLLAAIDAAGLTETLSGGEYTIFAPTDEAFAQLPEGLVDSLLEDPGGNLTQILLYHVIAGKRTVEENLGLKSVVTLQGESLEFETIDGVPTINGVAAITEFDIEAENGMVHVIDTVLVPPIAVPL